MRWYTVFQFTQRAMKIVPRATLGTRAVGCQRLVYTLPTLVATCETSCTEMWPLCRVSHNFLLKTVLYPWKGLFFPTVPFPTCDQWLVYTLRGPFYYRSFPFAQIGLLFLTPSLGPNEQSACITETFLESTHFNPEDGGSTFLRKVSICLQNYIQCHIHKTSFWKITAMKNLTSYFSSLLILSCDTINRFWTDYWIYWALTWLLMTLYKSLLHRDQCSQSCCLATAPNGRHPSVLGSRPCRLATISHHPLTAGLSC
jgi:hypothetical protein